MPRAKPARQYATKGPLATRFGLRPGHLEKMIEAGAVGTRQLPGCPLEIFVPDVERVLAQSVKPAGKTAAM